MLRTLSVAARSFVALTIFAAALAGGIPTARADLDARLSGPDRSADDRARDAGRKPAAVVRFLGIEPGMKVVDVVASGGWYTEVLSIAVGGEGRVYAQNPPVVLEIRDGEYDKELSARLAGGRLANVERVDANLGDSKIPDASLDAAITALNFHDVYARGEDAALAFLVAVHQKLRPGGVFGIIDHDGKAGANNAELHRIEKRVVLDLIERSPFSLDGESDILANPDDDHGTNVFSPEIRGKTDRFVLRLRKSKP